jgi:UV DNA damage repair endonuclease
MRVAMHPGQFVVLNSLISSVPTGTRKFRYTLAVFMGTRLLASNGLSRGHGACRPK